MAESGATSGFSRAGSSYVTFKSGENASRIPEKKRSKDSQDQEHRQEEEKKEEETLKVPEYVDRSAQLSATLNSLALINAAQFLKKGFSRKDIPISIKKGQNIFYK